jgi:hypothetical protein
MISFPLKIENLKNYLFNFLPGKTGKITLPNAFKKKYSSVPAVRVLPGSGTDHG